MRIRTIKPQFFLNEELARLDPNNGLHRLLFIGLWCASDSEGRCLDRPTRLKPQILPYDDCDLDAMMDDLAAQDFIRRYEVNGQKLIQVTTFLLHQRIGGREAEKKSEYPPPPENWTPPVKKTRARAKAPPEPPAGEAISAEAIYEAYPRQVGKPAALLAIGAACRKVGPVFLLERVRAYAAAVNGQNPRFIPFPEKFFTEERYNDDPTTWQRTEDPGRDDAPGARVDRFTAGDPDQYEEFGRTIDIDHPYGLPPVPTENPPPDA